MSTAGAMRLAGARPPHHRLPAFAATLLLVLLAAAGARADDEVPGILSAVIGVHAEVPEDARTAAALGTRRDGSGVVIDGNGLVLTIGYLIMEATRVELEIAGTGRVPAEIVAYDHESGFGLLRAIGELPVQPMPLGDSKGLDHSDQVLVVAANGPGAVRPAFVVARRPFAGYWEYLLENAIFTAPAHPTFGGAALVDEQGELLGIGSLIVPDALSGERTVAGNMFVPVEILKPILGELLAHGRSAGPHRPWIGVYADEVQGRLFVTRVATGGPAEQAGISAGDIILGVGGEPVRTLEAFYRRLWSLGEAGDEVTLTVLQGVAPAEIRLRSSDRYAWLRLEPAR